MNYLYLHTFEFTQHANIYSSCLVSAVHNKSKKQQLLASLQHQVNQVGFTLQQHQHHYFKIQQQLFTPKFLFQATNSSVYVIQLFNNIQFLQLLNFEQNYFQYLSTTSNTVSSPTSFPISSPTTKQDSTAPSVTKMKATYAPFSSLSIQELPLNFYSNFDVLANSEQEIISIIAFQLENNEHILIAVATVHTVNSTNSSSNASTSKPRKSLNPAVQQHMQETKSSSPTPPNNSSQQQRIYLHIYSFTEQELISYATSASTGISASSSSSTNSSISGNPSSTGTITSGATTPLTTGGSNTLIARNHKLDSFELSYVPLKMEYTTWEWDSTTPTTTTTTSSSSSSNSTTTTTNSNKTNVLLVCGNDKSVHTFVIEDVTNKLPRIVETKSMTMFPYIASELPCSILWMQHFDLENESMRFVAIGFQNGFLKVVQMIKNQPHATKTQTLFMNSPISCVKFMKVIQPLYKHSLIEKINATHKSGVYDCYTEEALHGLHLIVCESAGRAILFRNVKQHLLQDGMMLMNYNETHYDSILCCDVLDANMDGIQEILLGTFNNKLHIFELVLLPTNQLHKSSAIQYKLQQTIRFTSPVYSIDSTDINNDGVVELIVSTMYSVHILQPDLKQVSQLMMRRLQKVSEIVQLENKMQKIMQEASR